MTKKSFYPVFYDPQNRRWRRFKRIVQPIAIALIVIFTALIASTIVNPGLPNLGLSPVRSILAQHHFLPGLHKTLNVNRQPEISQISNLNKHPAKSTFTGVNQVRLKSSYQSELIGFYVNWDDNSFTSLKQNISRLDKLMPEWLHLKAADGSILIDDEIKQKRAIDFIQQNRPELPIIPLINNYDDSTQSWNGAKLTQMLANPKARHNLIAKLLVYVRSNNFAGISIDFENIPANNQAMLTTFMQEIYTQFHPLGLEVSESVPLDDPGFNYRALANFNDYMILMAYDEHDSTSESGPIASQSWYAEKLQRRFAELPANKYVIAIGNYGYDWEENSSSGKELSFQEALQTAKDSEGKIALDSASLNPTFDYYDEKDKLHHVWFLDAITAFNELIQGQRDLARGFALWRMGGEDPSIWQIFERRNQLDASTAQMLRKVGYGYDIDYEGEGEVLKVTATPRDGSRNINYDRKSGLITAERLISYPSPYTITRWGGGNKKKIALTFDDGPDPRFTPAVLDILQHYNVKATFFTIGMNGSIHPDLLQRIVNEGHEIGSHTFTHPNISMTSEEQLEIELNATERLFESKLGLRTVLFRPPYAEDVEPETPDQVEPLLFTGKLGYYTIGMQIDPNDWRNPGVDKIVKETIAQAVSGQGNVVLLHDSGGDRSQTIAALPKIIEGLRSKGFQLVTVSDLIGLSRNSVMPPTPKNEEMIADVDGAGFLLIDWLSLFTYYLFLVGIALSIMRLLFIATLAVYEWFIRRRVKYSSEYMPSVSVIVPAFNEEKVICKTISHLLASDYPNFNVIVVDDDSRDRTYELVVEAFGNEPRVLVFTKPNGGKAQALNYGIYQTDAEIIVALDADTILRPNAISNLVPHFVDPQVGAIAGNAKVGNRLNLLTNWQALEYITSQNLERRAFGLLNCISVVPGAIGAWRRQLVVEAGGFPSDTLAEDADLTLTILRMGYKIDYEQNAIALTEAPDTIPAFLKQRFRWMYGTLQAAWKHRDTLFRRRYGALGMFAIPNVFVFQIGFPLVSPLMDLVLLMSIAWTIWQQHQHPAGTATEGQQQIILYYLLFLTVDFLAASIAFMLERKEDPKLLIWLVFQRFCYRQLMYYVAIKSSITAIKGTIVGWGKLERKATVQ